MEECKLKSDGVNRVMSSEEGEQQEDYITDSKLCKH